MSDSTTPTAEAPPPRERVRPQRLHVFHDYFATLLEPEFRPIFGSVVVVLTTGTLLFHWLEDWSLLDALYFSVVTLATIGYGDLTPTTNAAKLVAILYIFVGVGILGVFISAVSHASMQRTLERREKVANPQTKTREQKLEKEI